MAGDQAGEQGVADLAQFVDLACDRAIHQCPDCLREHVEQGIRRNGYKLFLKEVRRLKIGDTGALILVLPRLALVVDESKMLAKQYPCCSINRPEKTAKACWLHRAVESL